MREHLYLLMVDVDKIQEFIFNSTRLKHIVGASIAIASLTSRRFCTDRNLLDESKKEEDINKLQEGNWMEIYFGGGNMKLLFAERVDAENFVRKYQLEFAKTTDSASFTSIIYKIGITNPGEFEKGLKEAEQELNRVKHSKLVEQTNFANPIFDICPFCNKQVSESGYLLPNPDKDIKEPACKDCYRKDQFQSKERLNGAENTTMMSRFVTRYPQNQFVNEFADFKTKEGALMAIVTIDGNRFGKKIFQMVNMFISNEPDDKKVNAYIRQLNQISTAIEEATLEAMKEAFNAYKNLLVAQTSEKDPKTLFRPIIMGGDDICFVMEGKLALEFSEKLIAALEKNFSANELDVTFACGITIAKPTFPFFIAHQLAEALLGNVKKVNRDRSGFDFEVLYSTSVENLEQLRQSKYHYSRRNEKKPYITTLRPYFFNDQPEEKEGELSFRGFNRTLSIAWGLKNRDLLARNKIKMLRTLVRKGKIESEYEFNRMVSRMSDGKRRDIRKRLERIYPKGNDIWIETENFFYNNFIDISELNELYPVEKIKDHPVYGDTAGNRRSGK